MIKKKYLLIGIFGLIIALITYKMVDFLIRLEFGDFLIKTLISCSITISICFIAKAFGVRYRWSFVFLILIEVFIAIILECIIRRYYLPNPVKVIAANMYMNHCRNVIQFDPNNANYDDKLFYKLKPGINNFSNLEFSTQLYVNSKGFRDDEASLGSPEIVFLGDSYTMGWGVEQDETFANIIEKKIKKKSLNMGVSSYGTAREIISTDFINLDDPKLIILQYGIYDEFENSEFVKNEFTLPISTKKDYFWYQRWNKVWKNWFPLKYCFSLFLNSITFVHSHLFKEVALVSKTHLAENELKDFFSILNFLQKKYKGEILLIHFTQHGQPNDIAKQFKIWIRKNNVNKVHVLDLSDHIESCDYFVLDDHLNATGHMKVANHICDFINKNDLLK